MLYWAYTVVFQCCRRIFNKKSQTIQRKEYPWLVVTAELENGNVLDMTTIVQNNVYTGMKVTPRMLSTLSGVYPTKWTYLDDMLNEHDFPSDGLVI